MVQISTKKLSPWLGKFGWRLALAALVSYVLVQKDVDMQIRLNAAAISQAIQKEIAASPETDDNTPSSLISSLQFGPEIVDAISRPAADKQTKKKASGTTYEGGMLANDYANMTYHKQSNASKNRIKKPKKIARQHAYIKRFAHVAQAEMEKFGIPASITLAQGLIESDAGYSRLAQQNNNHFGMKCFSKKCKKGHCSNFTDDSHKDFFRKYKTAWESFRAHSRMLTGKRYRPLHSLGKKDYKAWAKGLKKAGYATDRRYAEKLIHIIEEMNLHEYDQ